jgi:hypothetical protein
MDVVIVIVNDIEMNADDRYASQSKRVFNMRRIPRQIVSRCGSVIV